MRRKSHFPLLRSHLPFEKLLVVAHDLRIPTRNGVPGRATRTFFFWLCFSSENTRIMIVGSLDFIEGSHASSNGNPVARKSLNSHIKDGFKISLDIGRRFPWIAEGSVSALQIFGPSRGWVGYNDRGLSKEALRVDKKKKWWRNWRRENATPVFTKNLQSKRWYGCRIQVSYITSQQ